jgi:hypothetical protein
MEGDILITDSEGRFEQYIENSPRKFIYAISMTPHGMVVAGQKGGIWQYNTSTT